MSVVVSGVLCRFKLAFPSLLFLLYNGRNRSAQPWLRPIKGITVSLGRLRCEYFENTSGRSSSEESSSDDEPDFDCSMIKATSGTVNFAACGNYRPHFTEISKIWQDRSPIQKTVAFFSCDVETSSSFYCASFCSILRRKMSFRDDVDWRFLMWRRLAHSFFTQFLFLRSPSWNFLF